MTSSVSYAWQLCDFRGREYTLVDEPRCPCVFPACYSSILHSHAADSRIPFALATSLGLAALAMQLPITPDEADAGLVPPATAYFVLGNGGATLILIMLFMAVTSTGSAELIAVSSLVSYDVYRAYINPEATGEQILKVSRYTVLLFGAFMGALSIVLNEIGLSLGWVYLFMGIVIGSAVVPVSMVLTWSKATAAGAMSGAILGQICGVIAWLVSNIWKVLITVRSLSLTLPMKF